MTLLEIVQEVHERTHWPELDILETIRREWPTLIEFKPVQVRLMVNRIERSETPQSGEAAL